MIGITIAVVNAICKERGYSAVDAALGYQGNQFYLRGGKPRGTREHQLLLSTSVIG